MHRLSEPEFEILADSTLNDLIEALSDLEDDRLDADLESGVLTVRFDDGAKHVINSHRAAGQIWMAAGSTAWHFDWDGARWVAGRTGDELWVTVEAKVAERLGGEIRLERKSERTRGQGTASPK